MKLYVKFLIAYLDVSQGTLMTETQWVPKIKKVTGIQFINRVKRTQVYYHSPNNYKPTRDLPEGIIGGKCEGCSFHKQQLYNIHILLVQQREDVMYASSNCKYGKGTYSENVATTLCTVLVYEKLRSTAVPDDLVCTQVAKE